MNDILIRARWLTDPKMWDVIDYTKLRHDVDRALDLDKSGNPEYVAMYGRIQRRLARLAEDAFDPNVIREVLRDEIILFVGGQKVATEVKPEPYLTRMYCTCRDGYGRPPCPVHDKKPEDFGISGSISGSISGTITKADEAENMFRAAVQYLERCAPHRLKILLPVQRENMVGSQCYIQPVPDHCDRILWKNSYHPLPPADMRASKEMADQAREAVRRLAACVRMDDGRSPSDAIMAYINLTSRGN